MDTKEIASLLGSSRVVPIDGVPCGGPLDLLRIAVQIKKLQSEAEPIQDTLPSDKDQPKQG